jgi:Bacterial Ig-like domain (group 2)
MRTVSPIVYATVAALLLACSESTGPDIKRPDGTSNLPRGSLRVSPAAIMIQSGQTFRLTTRYIGDPALASRPSNVAWTSSDASVATVSGGLVSGVSGGQTRIVASWGGSQATALVTVVAPLKKHEGPPLCPEQKLNLPC